MTTLKVLSIVLFVISLIIACISKNRLIRTLGIFVCASSLAACFILGESQKGLSGVSEFNIPVSYMESGVQFVLPDEQVRITIRKEGDVFKVDVLRESRKIEYEVIIKDAPPLAQPGSL